jgi:peptidoglycan hydrolase-like protein with peptidoglycan-binding domain
MKTGLLSALTAFPALALRNRPLAILLTLCSGDNLYATGPECGTSSAPVLLSQRDAVVKQVQLALRQRGYYTHAIDGFMGLYTQEAIQRFQVDHCVRTAPLVTRRLLISLGIERDGKSVVGPKSAQNVRPPVVDYAKPFHFARKINSGHGARRRICSASQPKANRVSQL